MPKHVAAFCDPGRSHIKNTAAIGLELLRRGHRFTLFHVPQLEQHVVNEGVPFVPLRSTRGNSGRRNAVLAQEGILYPAKSDQEGHSIKNFLRFAKQSVSIVCDAAPDVLRAERADLVLADMAEPGPATVAEHLGLPFVTICHALPLHRDRSVPPDFLPWSYRTEWWAKLRNVLAYQARDLMIHPLHRVLNQYRGAWGLRAHRTPEDSFSPYAQITQLVPGFDFPGRALPECLHYVGPYRRVLRNQPPLPFRRLDTRPLVYASLGTSQGHRMGIWQTVAKSCAELDVQLVISLGGAERTANIERLPGDPLVLNYAPQMELLAKATVSITHAGLNTAMEALAAGVPMIALPITGDQFGVAARIGYRGVGKVLGPGERRAWEMAAALRQVLNDQSYAMRARELKRAIEGTRGAEAAADIIEQVMFTGRPVRAG